MPTQQPLSPSHKAPPAVKMATLKPPPRRSERRRLQREQHNQDALLLNLPAEIRNMIFSLALPSDELFTITPYQQRVVEGNKLYLWETICTASRYQKSFGLTQVSRQIRAETLKLAYAVNTFNLVVYSRPWADDATSWIDSRPSEVLPLINKLAVHPGSDFEWHEGWCGTLHVTFDFKLEGARILYSGCEGCKNTHQLRVASYSELVQQDRLSTRTPRDKLVKVIDGFRDVFAGYMD